MSSRRRRRSRSSPLPAAVKAGYSLNALVRLPVGVLQVGGRAKRNYESQGYGADRRCKRAIEVSCDTVFYKFAYETWLRDGGLSAEDEREGPVHRDGEGVRARQARPGSTCPASRTAGSPTGPGSAPTGRRPRTSTAPRRRPATRRSRARTRAAPPTCCSCRRRTAPTATPTAAVTRSTSRSGRATRRRRRCRWRGSTRRSPTAARLVTPQIGRAVVTPEGSWSSEIEPKPAGRLPARRATAELPARRAARRDRAAAPARAVLARRFPLDQDPGGRPRPAPARSTASRRRRGSRRYAPANKPQYAVVMMVSQGGTGSGVAGPAVARASTRRCSASQGQDVDLAEAAPPGGHADDRPAEVATRRHRDARRRTRGPLPTGCPTCPSSSCGPTGATREAADADRLPPDAVHGRRRSDGPRACWTATPRCGARLGAAARRAGAVRDRRRAGVVGDPAGRRSTAGGDPQAFLKRHLLNLAIGLVLGVVPSRCSTTGCCAPTRRSSTCCRSSGWSRCSRRSARRSTARTRGSCCRPASRCSRRSSRRSPWSSAWRCCSPRSATPRTTPRDVDVVLGAGVRRRADGAGHAAARPRHRDRARRDRARDGRRLRRAAALGGRPASSAPSLVAFVAVQAGVLEDYQIDRFTRVLPTRPPTPRAPATTRSQARIAIGSGGVDGTGPVRGHADPGQVRARAADRLHLHRRGGGARVRRWRALIVLLLGVVLWRAVRIAPERRGPVRHAGGDRGRRAGSRSRPSRTSG